jgi:hypothetical protein
MKTLAIYEQLATDFPTVPKYRQMVAFKCTEVGEALKTGHRLRGAEKYHRGALTEWEKLSLDFSQLAGGPV